MIRGSKTKCGVYGGAQLTLAGLAPLSGAVGGLCSAPVGLTIWLARAGIPSQQWGDREHDRVLPREALQDLGNMASPPFVPPIRSAKAESHAQPRFLCWGNRLRLRSK